MYTKFTSLFLLFFMLAASNGNCQVAVNTDGSQPDPSAMLDIKSATKGFLPPRVILTSLTSASPVTNPAIGLLVFNKVTSGTSPNDIHAGYYFWNGEKWVPASTPQGSSFGDMLYWNNIQWVKIPVGLDGQVLTLVNGVPTWGQPSAQTPSLVTIRATVITNISAVCGGNVSDGGAIITDKGVCWSTCPNPTISNNKTSEGGGDGVFTSSIGGLETNTLYYIRAFATTMVGTSYGNVESFRTWECGLPITINHTPAGGLAPVEKTVTYNTVSNIPGETMKCWITSNLGADHQATSVNDSSEASAGWYWQFNRRQGYKNDGLHRTPDLPWISLIDENLSWESSNDPCLLEIGNSWRLPSFTEWSNLISGGNWTNWNGPWDSELKMHAAGFLNANDGMVSSRGHRGVYWSNAQNSNTEGWYLTFISGLGSMDYYEKAFGFSVRCIKE